MSSAAPPTKAPPKIGIKEIYLICYNALCCLGWSYVLALGVPSLYNAFVFARSSSGGAISNVDALKYAGSLMYYSNPRTAGYTDDPNDLTLAFVLTVVQSMAMGEIVHAMAGLVRSPVFVTALQVGSRIAALHFVNSSPKAQGELLLATYTPPAGTAASRPSSPSLSKPRSRLSLR
jgi:hypothetical protein